MENILGRQNDHLTSKDGKKIYASYFHHLLDGQNWIKAFQFRQKRLEELELIIEVEENNNSESSILVLKENLLKRIIQVLGNNLKLEIKVVKNIEKTIAGKHRFVINEIEK
jgi:phenylacetate-CoA ligase